MNDKQRAKYEACKAAGICVQCRKRPARENRIWCEECAEKSRQYGIESRTRRYAKRKELVEKRMELGII